ncbi:hypothetical protein [Pseudomonas typographi]|uniref:hypothetical protein n=1 Tax=Pseudomonas typographi TaxID=2715964 RepID=UPI0016886764|nr:hypothetical protein [Pseudomonas typographi]MBD1553412.1 hypothetical protein [Pseudomonas typographi]
MIRRLAALTHVNPAREQGATSPLMIPMLAVGLVLIAGGVACASPVQMLIGAFCSVAGLLCQRKAPWQ